MAKVLIIDSKTKIIRNIIEEEKDYGTPQGREMVKGTGKIGEVYKPKAAKKAASKSTA